MYKGTFIGKDGSMGFVHGREYHINLRSLKRGVFRRDWILLTDKQSKLNCPYRSIETLLKNWNITYKK